MEILVVLIVGLLIAGPVIAIVAYIRVQDLTAKLNSIGLHDSVTRLNSLEQRLSSLDKKLAALATSAPTHPAPQPMSERPSIQPTPPSGFVPSPATPSLGSPPPRQTEDRTKPQTPPPPHPPTPHPQHVSQPPYQKL